MYSGTAAVQPLLVERLTTTFDYFRKEKEVMADMVKAKRMVNEGKAKHAKLVEAAKPIWRMLYADDAGVVSKSPRGLGKMMPIIVCAAGRFELLLPEAKMEFDVCARQRGEEVLVDGQRQPGWCSSKRKRLCISGETSAGTGALRMRSIFPVILYLGHHRIYPFSAVSLFV